MFTGILTLPYIRPNLFVKLTNNVTTTNVLTLKATGQTSCARYLRTPCINRTVSATYPAETHRDSVKSFIRPPRRNAYKTVLVVKITSLRNLTAYTSDRKRTHRV
jgi:hypothetical protein